MYTVCLLVKLEEMDKAQSFITKRLGFTTKLKYKPPAKGRFSNTYSSYYKQLPNTTIAALADIYKEDIDIFRYPPSPFQ